MVTNANVKFSFTNIRFMAAAKEHRVYARRHEFHKGARGKRTDSFVILKIDKHKM